MKATESISEGTRTKRGSCLLQPVPSLTVELSTPDHSPRQMSALHTVLAHHKGIKIELSYQSSKRHLDVKD